MTTLDGEVTRMAGVALSSTPGTRYGYSNANYVLLGATVQAATGRAYAEAMADLVFEPLEMTRTSADLATAERNGLGDAHRLWFGLADTHRPLFRPDIVPGLHHIHRKRSGARQRNGSRRRRRERVSVPQPGLISCTDGRGWRCRPRSPVRDGLGRDVHLGRTRARARWQHDRPIVCPSRHAEPRGWR
jgi:CubicO group peptidase (beta-lactamase class C family)